MSGRKDGWIRYRATAAVFDDVEGDRARVRQVKTKEPKDKRRFGQ